MKRMILGLDIGGANLKAATADGRALTVPFALWKQPERLPVALAELVAHFPQTAELAVTMTGELCDCYETKRQGVNAILDAVRDTAADRPVRVWSVDGEFLPLEESRANSRKVAASNWHALATFAGRFAPHHGGLLIDIGSTTTDIIPLNEGTPYTLGRDDQSRMANCELVYAGVRRTPVAAVYQDRVASELFATTRDVYIVLGLLPEKPNDTDTADGRAATFDFALARLARMLGADRDMMADDEIIHFATKVHTALMVRLKSAATQAYYGAQSPPELRTVIVSGEGEFLARRIFETSFSGAPITRVVALNDELGPVISACAPAYALAVLAMESPS